MEKSKSVNNECNYIPKLRLDVIGDGDFCGTAMWLDGKYLTQGVRKIEFIAEGGGVSPILKVEMNLSALEFEPGMDLVQKQQPGAASAGDQMSEYEG